MAIELTNKMSGIDFKDQVSKALDKTGDTMTGALIPRTVAQPNDYAEDEVVPYSVVKSNINDEANKTKADIYADIYKVGNILSTVRTDLDDTWLLCNGDVLDQYEYEDLFQIYLDQALPLDNVESTSLEYHRYLNISPGVSGCRYTQLTKIEGNWILLGYAGTTDTPQPKLFYRENLSEGVWKEITLQIRDIDDDYVKYNTPRKIVYNGEYWVVMTGRYLYYSKSLDGEWVLIDPQDYIEGILYYDDECSLSDIIYEDGIWVLVGQGWRGNTGASSSSALLMYTEDLSSNSWNITSFPYSGALHNIVRVDNSWIVTGVFYKKGYSGELPGIPDPNIDYDDPYFFSFYASSEDLSKSTEEWCYVLEYDDDSILHSITKLVYINNVLIKYCSTDSVYYVTDFEDVKTDKSKWISLSAGQEITYTQGVWVTLYDSGILKVTEDLGGEWTEIDSLYTGGNSSFTSSDLIVDGGYIYAKPYQSGNVHYASHPLGDFKLPSISLNGVYTYIKAKEQQKKEE